MSQEPSYFLVPASSGLAIQPKNGGVFTAEVDGGKQQQWYIERDTGGKVSFRNVNSDQYLRTPAGHKGAKVTVGKKQFFSLEPSNTPNAFWWAHEPYWTQTMLWYIHDYKSWSEHKDFPIVRPGSSSELEAKEQAIKEKSERIETKEKEFEQKVKDLEAREKAIKEQAETLSSEQAQLEEAQKQAAATNSERLLQQKELAKLQKSLESRELAVANEDKTSSKNQAPDSSMIDNLQQELSTTESELAKAQAAYQEESTKRAELAQREKDIRKAYEALQKRQAGEEGTETNSFGTKVGGPGNIFARRVHSDGKEPLAATVGNRTEPPGLRTSRMIGEGDRRPITMQRHFGSLPRLV